jgi:hypothetical protein
MIKRLLMAAWLCFVLAAVSAHELPANRLTLVLRDETLLSLTYRVDYTAALHQALAPKRALQEFVVMYSAMKPADFQKEMVRAQTKFSSGTRLVLPTGESLPITRWYWPEPSRVQAQLQERAMQALVGAGDHEHETSLEIGADVTARRHITSVALRLPEAFGKVMVVSYQPRQAWVEPRAAASLIKF